MADMAGAGGGHSGTVTARPPAVWEAYVPPEELARLLQGGRYGRLTSAAEEDEDALPPPGARVALLVIDVVLSFLGPRPDSGSGGPAERTEPHYVTICGPDSWTRLPTIRSLLDAARGAGLPRVLTRGCSAQTAVLGGAIKALADGATARRVDEAPFPAELQPADGDFVLDKARASAFFGTPLVTYLHQHRVDTLVIAGTTTSGCVRATVTDAASHGFAVYVAQDACFDRSPFAHAANLLDIQTTYGEVVDAETAHRLLATARRPEE